MLVSDMLRIAHYISDKVHTISPLANVQSTAEILAEKGIGALPVIDNGKLVGIVSERDIVTKTVTNGLNPRKTLVSNIMTKNPTVVFPNYNLNDCLDMMERGRFRHLPVIDNGKLIGMISIRDILVALVKEKEDLADHFQRFIIANR